MTTQLEPNFYVENDNAIVLLHFQVDIIILI